jgi:hypothetical protein
MRTDYYIKNKICVHLWLSFFWLETIMKCES